MMTNICMTALSVQITWLRLQCSKLKYIPNKNWYLVATVDKWLPSYRLSVQYAVYCIIWENVPTLQVLQWKSRENQEFRERFLPFYRDFYSKASIAKRLLSALSHRLASFQNTVQYSNLKKLSCLKSFQFQFIAAFNVISNDKTEEALTDTSCSLVLHAESYWVVASVSSSE